MKSMIQVVALVIAIPMAAMAADVTIDGGRGEIPVHVPDNYNADTAAPLVVLLHGYTSSGKQQDAYMKFSKLADVYGYIFMAPDGTREESPRKSRFWNATDACCNFHGSDVDDSAYLKGLIEQIKSDYTIDANKVFLIGHSNGGFMSYRMAYDHPETIAAIASLAGASLPVLDKEKPKNPVSILQIHGTKDATIDFKGGTIGNDDYPGAEESAKLWAAYNGCPATAEVTQSRLDLDRRIEGEETSVTRYTSECNRGGAVELWTIEGGSHIPRISESFGVEVIEWLFAHAKPDASAATD